MYLYDDKNQIINAECSIDQVQGIPCVVIESSGGGNANQDVRRRNPEYNKLLSVLLYRLVKTGTQITSVVLDAINVADIPIAQRVANLNYPIVITLDEIQIENSRRMLQRVVAQMHRIPNAAGGGNRQRKIRICLSQHINPDQLIYAEGKVTVPDEEEFEPDLTETQRFYLQSSRIGQGQFRESLFQRYQSKCAITGIEHDQLLIASHIKPWAACTNKERLDQSNGILLSALMDRLFDKGLISFEDDGKLIVSKKLSKMDILKCGIEQSQILKLTAESKKYMEYHRSKFMSC